MVKAHDYDKKAIAIWRESSKHESYSELVPCFRREALVLLAAGKPRDAVQLLGFTRRLILVTLQWWAFISWPLKLSDP